jgi:Spy/CpxP family protein refolding chaperone
MRKTFLILAACALAACSSGTEPAATPVDAVTEAMLADVVPEYALSPATAIDAAGIGAARFPEELKLTAEQKAAIHALHEQFLAANKADIAALQKIHDDARAAIKAGKSREEVRAILERAIPIRARLDARFEALRAAIWAIYTPEQRAWLEAHKPKPCVPGPALTEAQRAQIKALQEAFIVAVKADLELIKAVHEEAKAARAAGKSREEVATILAKALPAMERVRAAERRLAEEIEKVLTPEQRNARCGR